MKISFIIPLVALLLSVSFTNAQDLKDIKKQIKEQQAEIRVNEEMLLSGVESLERTKARFEKDKTSFKVSKEDVLRKEKVIKKVEDRLSKLDQDIKDQKAKVKELKAQYSALKKGKPEVAKAEKPAKPEVAKEKEKAERDEKLKIAREKLEAEKRESEAKIKKQEEALKLEKEKIAKEAVAKPEKPKANPISEEKLRKIQELEDDVIVNEEMLISGQKGLERSMARLESAKADGASPEDIERKEAIIKRLKDRLENLKSEIKEKKEMISLIKGK